MDGLAYEVMTEQAGEELETSTAVVLLGMELIVLGG